MIWKMIHKIVGRLWKKIPRWTRKFLTRVYQSKFTASAGVVILNSKGEILLLDHQIRPGNGWGIPGGFIDRGEQPEEAAVREVLEETALELDSLELVDFRTRETHIEFLYRARANGIPKIDGSEILGFEWFKADLLPQEMPQSQRDRIKGAVKDWFDN